MAILSKSNLISKFNALFADNTTGEISEADLRTFVQDLSDSLDGVINIATVSGTNTYTATGSPTVTAYATGQKYLLKFTNTSTTSCTLNIDSLGDKKIFIDATNQARSRDIFANGIYILIYDATLDSSAGGFIIIARPSYIRSFRTVSCYDDNDNLTGNFGASGSDASTTRGLWLRAGVVTGIGGTSDGFHVMRFNGSDNKIFYGDDGSTSIIQTGHKLYLTVGVGSNVDATASPNFYITGSVAGFEDKGFEIDSDISPAQITSNQNDYAPTGADAAYTFRLSTDASRTITSINATQTDGREILVMNVGSNDIVFEDEAIGPNGTDVNRFLFGGSNFTLTADQATRFIYDGTSLRWRRQV